MNNMGIAVKIRISFLNTFQQEKGENFAIAHKYRTQLNKQNQLEWSNQAQLQRYQEFAYERRIPVFIVIGLELPFKSKYYPDEIAYEKCMFNIPLKNAKYPALNRIFMQISKRIRKNLLLEKWEIILK